MKLFRTGLLLLLALTLPQAVLGWGYASFPRSETAPLRWKVPSIKIAVSTSLTQRTASIKEDSDVLAVVRRSLDTWERAADVEFELVVSEKQSASPSGPAGDKVNLITIAGSPENVLMFSRGVQGDPAKTRVFYNRAGSITEADIVLNPFQQFSTDGSYGTFDLEATITHEVGHLLGLRHSDIMASAMAANLVRNGGPLTSDLSGRRLAASDIAAVRDLYGPADEVECCAVVTGRLTSQSSKRPRNVYVVLENEDGAVVAETETTPEGTYRIGGLMPGTYSLFYRLPEETALTAAGAFVLGPGETSTFDAVVGERAAPVVLDYIGLNSQLTDAAVGLVRGGEYTVYIGGSGLDPQQLGVQFSTPFLRVVPESMARRDFGDEVEVVSFTLQVAAEIPDGIYTLYASNGESRGAMIGAVYIK